MHEFSVAQNIVDIAIQAAEENQVQHISSVEVEIGQAAGVVIEALNFAWESAAKNTLLERSKLVIKSIPLVVVCRTCGLQYNPRDFYEVCPHCGDMNPKVLKGRELRVSALIT